MIITLDTETQGLNAQRFLMGCLCFENHKKETYSDKKLLYARILDLASKEQTRHRRLTIYAHNLQYDYIAIGAHEDTANIPYSLNPLIVDHILWQEDGRQLVDIKWIDTMGLWRGSLASLGEAIGVPKGDTPPWLLLDDYTPSSEELSLAQTYMEHDCDLLMTYLQQLKSHLWHHGVRPHMIITSGQIAMSYFTKKLKEQERQLGVWNNGWHHEQHRPITTGRWLSDVDGGVFHPTTHTNDIMEALRGGRVQAFRTGSAPDATQIDANSLYPFIASTMRFPDLTTEKKITLPLKRKGITPTTLFEQLGISRCIISTPLKKQALGYLPVRAKTTNDNGPDEETTWYPVTTSTGRTILFGTWTHGELSRALQLGYTIHHISWSITWSDGINPLHDFFTQLYTARQASTGFENLFFKQMMNSLIGKFSQHRNNRELTNVDIEESAPLQQQGWEVLFPLGTRVIMERTTGVDIKRHHCPIISILTTAGARNFLYDALTKIPISDLWYCDTDGIIMTDPHDTTSATFNYTKKLGDWKIVKQHVPLHLSGKKAYLLGDDVTLNRVPKRSATKTAYLSGSITYEDILGLGSKTTPALLGTRITRTRELHDTTSTPPPTQRIFIDTNNTPTEHELTTIKKVLTQWQVSNGSSKHSLSS